MGPGGGHAHQAVTDHDFLMLADNALAGDLEAYSSAGRFSGSDDRFFADELFFSSLDKIAEACGNRGDLRAQFMSVQRH